MRLYVPYILLLIVEQVSSAPVIKCAGGRCYGFRIARSVGDWTGIDQLAENDRPLPFPDVTSNQAHSGDAPDYQYMDVTDDDDDDDDDDDSGVIADNNVIDDLRHDVDGINDVASDVGNIIDNGADVDSVADEMADFDDDQHGGITAIPNLNFLDDADVKGVHNRPKAKDADKAAGVKDAGGTSGVKDSSDLSKAKDTGSTSGVKDINNLPKDKDVGSTSGVKDTNNLPKAQDVGSTSGVKETNDLPKAKGVVEDTGNKNVSRADGFGNPIGDIATNVKKADIVTNAERAGLATNVKKADLSTNVKKTGNTTGVEVAGNAPAANPADIASSIKKAGIATNVNPAAPLANSGKADLSISDRRFDQAIDDEVVIDTLQGLLEKFSKNGDTGDATTGDDEFDDDNDDEDLDDDDGDMDDDEDLDDDDGDMDDDEEINDENTGGNEPITITKDDKGRKSRVKASNGIANINNDVAGNTLYGKGRTANVAEDVGIITGRNEPDNKGKDDDERLNKAHKGKGKVDISQEGSQLGMSTQATISTAVPLPSLSQSPEVRNEANIANRQGNGAQKPGSNFTPSPQHPPKKKAESQKGAMTRMEQELNEVKKLEEIVMEEFQEESGTTRKTSLPQDDDEVIKDTDVEEIEKLVVKEMEDEKNVLPDKVTGVDEHIGRGSKLQNTGNGRGKGNEASGKDAMGLINPFLKNDIDNIETSIGRQAGNGANEKDSMDIINSVPEKNINDIQQSTERNGQRGGDRTTEDTLDIINPILENNNSIEKEATTKNGRRRDNMADTKDAVDIINPFLVNNLKEANSGENGRWNGNGQRGSNGGDDTGAKDERLLQQSTVATTYKAVHQLQDSNQMKDNRPAEADDYETTVDEQTEISHMENNTEDINQTKAIAHAQMQYQEEPSPGRNRVTEVEVWGGIIGVFMILVVGLAMYTRFTDCLADPRQRKVVERKSKSDVKYGLWNSVSSGHEGLIAKRQRLRSVFACFSSDVASDKSRSETKVRRSSSYPDYEYHIPDSFCQLATPRPSPRPASAKCEDPKYADGSRVKANQLAHASNSERFQVPEGQTGSISDIEAQDTTATSLTWAPLNLTGSLDKAFSLALKSSGTQTDEAYEEEDGRDVGDGDSDVQDAATSTSVGELIGSESDLQHAATSTSVGELIGSESDVQDAATSTSVGELTGSESGDDSDLEPSRSKLFFAAK